MMVTSISPNVYHAGPECVHSTFRWHSGEFIDELQSVSEQRLNAVIFTIKKHYPFLILLFPRPC